MSKLVETASKKPMTRKKFLSNQIALLIVVALFLIDKSMFTCWVRNFFNMLHIGDAEPIVMALFTPIKAVHFLAPAISQLCLLQFLFVFSFARVVFVLTICQTRLKQIVSIQTISEPKVNDDLENSQFTYKETQRFLC